MSQTSIASYFNTRKRPATEDLNYNRTKVFLAGNDDVTNLKNLEQKSETCRLIFNGGKNEQNIKKIELIANNNDNKPKIISNTKISSSLSLTTTTAQPSTRTRSGRTIKHAETTTNGKITKEKQKNDTPKLKQQNLVQFIKQGSLKLSPRKDESSVTAFTSKNNAVNVEKGSKKAQILQNDQKLNLSNLKKDKLDSLVKKELNFDEVKSKLTRSGKLQELKASINRLKELEKIRKLQEEKSRKLKYGESDDNREKQANLKKFETIELEVLTSPQKGFKTPTKPTSTITSCGAGADNKNELMSPKKTPTSKRILFSPTKDGSPLSKLNQIPAYQKYQNLIESGRPTLQLPYKYRYLIEMFRCVDSVCAMFYNRKEMITFKKLKPAVQRMARKNFNESHLAQIKNIYPDSYNFSQMKTRNFGSTSKQDYFQLVITPIVNGNCNKQIQKIDEDNVLKSAQGNAMNPQIMIDRLQKFTTILLNIAKNEHDKFLKSLNPPMNIPKDKITRWHPEFDLENLCPDIDEALLPQPPNIEKFSSAKDILSTARNLFNCATPMERAMLRLENKIANDKKQNDNKNNDNDVCDNLTANSTNNNEIQSNTVPVSNNPTTESILKGVPKSLLEKIRAKQAAKMLDSMTRRHSEDREATKYSRLPELARHLRNVFITEKKGVLPIEIVLKKIENSYRTILTQEDIELHLKLIEKELPQWIAFHEIRKTLYLKLNREMDLSKITERLTNIANEKFK